MRSLKSEWDVQGTTHQPKLPPKDNPLYHAPIEMIPETVSANEIEIGLLF